MYCRTPTPDGGGECHPRAPTATGASGPLLTLKDLSGLVLVETDQERHGVWANLAAVAPCGPPAAADLIFREIPGGVL